MVIGCLAETFSACTAAIPVYFNDFLHILLKNAKTDDSDLNRNIAYALGILAQHSGILLGQHLQPCLEALSAMYASSEEKEAKDNVISASCRVMQAYPTQVPFDTMLDFVLKNLPLTGDVNENETVLRYAMNLNSLRKKTNTCLKAILEPQKIQPYMQQITITCIQVLVDEKCDEIPATFKKEAAGFLKTVIMPTQLPLLQQIEAQMSAEEKQTLASFLS